MRLAGKVTLITGAASGQGRAAARLFAQEGSRLVISDINREGLEETAALVRADGGQVETVVGSVAVEAEARAMVERARDAFGKLDVLYNNAGIYWPHRGDGPVTQIDEAIWDTVLNTNLKGMYLCAKYAVPELIKTRGAIINIASVAGLRGTPTAHAYSASKGGVIALTYAMAASFGPQGVRVNAIAPGGIDTPMTAPMLGVGSPSRRSVEERIPLRRLGQPEDVARLALFLASDEASWITGEVYKIDGGDAIR